jgi:hypothetical protein
MGGGVSKESIEQLKNDFLAEDVNGDGTVSLEELKKYRQKAEGDSYNEAAVETDFKKFDKNGDGHLLLEEYLESHGVKHKLAESVSDAEAVKRAASNAVLQAESKAHDARGIMGESLSVPDSLDKKTAMILAGSDFNDDKFNALAVDGKITKQQFDEVKAATNATPAADSEETEAALPTKESVIELVHASQVKKDDGRGAGEDYTVDGKSYNTANDKAAEDEFTALAKEKDDVKEDDKGPGFVMLTTVEQADALGGTWERVIAHPTFYINSDTLEVSLSRPSSFQEEVEAKEVVEEVKIPAFHIHDMEAEVSRIFTEEKKTPLILARINDTPDTTTVVEHFAELKHAIVIDIKPLGLGFAKCGIKSEAVTEPARKRIVEVLKQGDMLIAFDMGDTAPNLATILKNKKHSKCIPPKMFEFGKLCGGTVARSVYRDEDREPPGETGKTVYKQNVNVVAVCSHTPEDYMDSLGGKMSVAMDKFYPIVVYSRS